MSDTLRTSSRTTPAPAAGRIAQVTFNDRTTHTLTDLAAAHQHLLANPPAPSPTGVLLRTCHRTEWYSTTTDGPVLDLNTRIVGHDAATARLAQIAAGCLSVIPGEAFIHRQVSHAFAALPVTHPLRRAAAEPLLLATEARRRFGLESRFDYTDLTRQLLTQPGPAAGTPTGFTAIVGGGMLARAVAADLAHDRAVIMITRDPKSLRNTLTRAGTPAVALRLTAARQDLAGHRFDLVLATNGIDHAYRTAIANLATNDGCQQVVDLCATPLLASGPGRRHLHDDDVLATIATATATTAERAAQAAAWIAGRMKETTR
ncbi:hypothetical protein [Kitasatospora sp. NBC_01300]|uniref:hypothetical protein n=1 Tax=Kitasatospora sp. NBC_01300 TaxID=2903574 RepID=UPI002F91B92A|nr:hypothetical protein OG556_39970 [Kitasatospora sp. NBC_01300]